MLEVAKPSSPFYLIVKLALTTFSAPPQILAASISFLLPNSRNEEMMGDGRAFGATAGLVCFEQ